MAKKRPITPAGYKRYAEEMEKLWHVERPRVVQEVADAAAHGDRSENAEYIYGKKRLREIDRRIRYLSNLLESVDVVDPKTMKTDQIKFGATVSVEDEDGQTRRYQIVGADESEAKEGRISVNSPVAKALLGKTEGDVVIIHRPAGELEVEVVSVEYI